MLEHFGGRGADGWVQGEEGSEELGAGCGEEGEFGAEIDGVLVVKGWVAAR